MLMVKNKTKTNKGIINTDNTAKLTVGYLLIAVWILFLAITDFLSWLGSYHEFMGTLYPPVSDTILYAVLFVPTAIISLPLAYYYVQDNMDQKNSLGAYSLMILQVLVINAVAYVVCFLLNILFHGFM